MTRRQVIYLIKKYKEIILLSLISIIGLIIGGLTIGWLISLLIILGIDILLFIPNKDNWLKASKGDTKVKVDNYKNNTRSARNVNNIFTSITKSGDI